MNRTDLFDYTATNYMLNQWTNLRCNHAILIGSYTEQTIHIYTIICLKSVCLSGDVRRLQVAILARSPREMSQTYHILPRYFLSRVRVSVPPRIFYTRKTYINYRKVRQSLNCLLNEKGRNAGLAGDRLTLSGKHTRAFNGHSTDRLSQHDENNKSKRRQREFIHSRLENVV